MKIKNLLKMIGASLLSTLFLTSNAQDSILIKTTADAYTWDRTAQSQNVTNYGSSVYLYSKIGAGMSNTDYGFPSNQANTYKRYTYLQFPTSSLPAVTTFSKVLVRLRAYARDASSYRYNGLKISKSDVGLWNENTITWANQPTLNATADSINVMHYGEEWTAYNALGTSANPPSETSIVNSSTFLYIDITKYINGLLGFNTLPRTLGFVIQGFTDGNGYGSYSYSDAARGNNGLYFLSKEYGIDSLAPTLVVYTTPETALPVSTSLLSATKSGKEVRLSWITYTESNTEKFIIERSADAKTYIAIDSIPAMGNSSIAHQYVYMDKNPIFSPSFYRWKERDLNGKIQYSGNIASINNGNTFSIQAKVYPNPIPVGNTLQITFTATKDETVEIQLVNISGNIISSKTISANVGPQTTNIATTGFAKGIYLLRLLNKSGNQIGHAEKILIK